MALSEQQKAENKAANKVRDRAHNERYRALDKALKGVDADEVVAGLRAKAEEAARKRDEAIEQRNERERELLAQIEAIKAQIAALKDDPTLEAAVREQRQAWNDWNQAKSARTAAVEAQFPDLQGHARFSSACWTPSPEVVALMDEARRTATPENTAPKSRKPRP